MNPVKIRDDIYWVGAIDWSLRNFHGYKTQRGSTYNAYLIIDDKVTLVDLVKPGFESEMLERISKIIDPAKIDYIISNHVEMDHSGALPELMNLCPDATIITSPHGHKGLNLHYKNNQWNFEVVKNEQVINLGKRNLQFALTPMVHWPDNMVEYIPEEKMLFTNDALGQHLASSERFDDEYPLNTIMEEAKKYYANIVLPYNKQVNKALDVIKSLDVEMIVPSHGLIWRSHVKNILAEYTSWASNKTDDVALVIYDTMWGSTQKLARAIGSAFEESGMHIDLLELQHNHVSDIMTKVLTAKYICVGSPTLNNTMLPTVAGFLAYFRGLAPKDRVGLAFGSYGWGGQSVKEINGILEGCGCDMMPLVTSQYIPDEEILAEISEKIKGELKNGN